MSDPNRKERKSNRSNGGMPIAESKLGPQDTPAMEKQLQYLRTLEERNRIKKKLEEHTKNDKVLQEKEMGFTTNFNGENANRKHKQHARPMEKTRAKSAGPTKLPLRQPQHAETKPEPKRESQSTGSLLLHGNDTNQPRPKQKWSKPTGVAEQRDGRLIFRDTESAFPDNTQADAKDVDCDGEDDDDENEEEYMDESFEEFEDLPHEQLPLHQPQLGDETKGVSTMKTDNPKTHTFHEEPINPLSQTTAELNGLIQGLSRDKQRELIGLLQTFTSSKKDASDVNMLKQSIGDPALWSQLTEPLAQLTNNQREWEADVQRKLKLEREASERLVAEAEARRAEMLKKFEAEERELESLMALKRLETLKRLQDMSAIPRPATTNPTPDNVVMSTPIPSPAPNLSVDLPVPPVSVQVPLDPPPNPPTLSPSPEKPLISRESNVVLTNVSMELPPAAPTRASTTDINLVSDMNASQGPRFEIRLKLLSSWGNTRVVGLTQISVYDGEGNELEILPETLKLFSGQVGCKPIPKSNSMVRDLTRLFNGMAHTTNDVEMWIGRQIDSNPLQIAFSVAASPFKVCIWNYNGKLNTAACVRDLEVFVENQCKWTGSLPESFGSSDENTCTWINVASSMKKKTVKQSASIPTATEAPPSTAAGNGPIWFVGRSDSTSKVTESLQNPDEDVKIKPLNLAQSISTADAASKPLTTRRRQLESSNSNDSLIATPAVPAPPPLVQNMPSLQSSWDTLEHFKRTNRSRLEPSDSKKEVFQSMEKASVDQRPPVLSRSSSKIEIPRAPVHIADMKRIIPTLPQGRKMVIECLSTWGDPYYIGLNGIDVFDDCGQRVLVSTPETQVSAVPASINILPEYASEKDPRVATNLVDRVNYTCDDLHMWLAPFTSNQLHAVTIIFDRSTAISMLRIWNYNKSRAHSFRGVKTARVVLDGAVIFQGEIRQAPGILASVDQCCEVILFTTDETILNEIEQVDADPTVDATLDIVHDIQLIPRPTTAEKEDSRRPKTSANHVLNMRVKDSPVAFPAALSKHSSSSSARGVSGRTIKFIFLSTWGDKHYIGLTGLRIWFLRQNEVVSIPLSHAQLSATPRDLHSLGYTGDPRTLDKLVDDTNVTCDDTHMWLVPFEGTKAELTIHLPSSDDSIYGLDIWNYNKSAEDTFRGAKLVQILIDGNFFAICAFRKAPGHALLDFKQTILFDDLAKNHALLATASVNAVYKTHSIKQDYEPPLHPVGFVIKFVLWSTWGDPYYVGLNGVELYDIHGQQLPPPTLMAASPSSLADVDVKHDVRVVENLFNGNNNTWDAGDAWLSPLASSLSRPDGNVVYAFYDIPVALSMVKIFNYSKSPERGAREIEIYVDDLKVYMGTLRQAPPAPGVTRLGKPQQGIEFGQPILFTHTPAIVEPEKRKILYCGSEEQDVLCINEGQVVAESKAMYRAPDPGAEGVVVDLAKRPTTALCRK